MFLYYKVINRYSGVSCNNTASFLCSFYPQANGFIMIDGEDVSLRTATTLMGLFVSERVVQNVLERVQASRTGDMVLQTIRDLARRPNQPGA